MKSLALCLAALLLPWSLLAVAPLESERAKLLEGVASIPRLGVPGSVVAYSAQAFPLVVARGARFAETLAAATTMGKGRVVIFGHTGYLDGGGPGDLDRLLLNAVRWCGRKEAPQVGIRGCSIGPLLVRASLSAKVIGKLDPTVLQGVEVLVYNAQGLTDPAEMSVLREFVERGGGLISGVTGWAFGQTSGGKDFAAAHLGNRLLADAGLAWTSETTANGSIEALPELSPALNALTAIGVVQGGVGAELETASRTLQLAIPVSPSIRASLQAALASNGVRPLDAAARVRATLEARLSQFLPPEQVTANAAAASFPGRVAAGSQPVTKTVSIEPAIPGWQSTGLYADAGAKIRIALPPECAGAGYSLRIGCHTDDLTSQESWNRPPEITFTAPLTAPETTVASAFGGLIYLVVPEKTKQAAPFPVTLAGGVPAPLYLLGQTTDAQWATMRTFPSPWAELGCKGVIITLPAAIARQVEKPADLMQFWQTVVDAEDELAGTAAQRRRPERIVPDVQISAGYMHSGYPIMIHLPQAAEMIRHGPTQWPAWGFYHEIGHNHQNPAWTFDGTVEVTCNLFSLYVVETVQHQPMLEGHPAIKPETQQKKRGLYRSAGAPFAQWKGDPFLALQLYIELIQGFGFDTLKKVLRSYHGQEAGPLPKSDDEKRDQWMLRYSKIAGRNLGPFFEAWGVPVSSAAKAGIANLPAWMPPEMN